MSKALTSTETIAERNRLLDEARKLLEPVSRLAVELDAWSAASGVDGWALEHDDEDTAEQANALLGTVFIVGAVRPL